MSRVILIHSKRTASEARLLEFQIRMWQAVPDGRSHIAAEACAGKKRPRYPRTGTPGTGTGRKTFILKNRKNKLNFAPPIESSYTIRLGSAG